MDTKMLRQSAYEQTRLEHEQIREQIELLHRQLVQRRASLEDIEQSLIALRDILFSHFHSEERDGFFEQIVARAPQLSRQADVLTHEHTALLNELDGLIQSVQGISGRPLCWQTLDMSFDDFTKKLMHHESAENGILQQAYVDDLGTKD